MISLSVVKADSVCVSKINRVIKDIYLANDVACLINFIFVCQKQIYKILINLIKAK